MAQIVLGIGSSHSPQLSMPSDSWVVRAERYDAKKTDLVGVDGNIYTYDELLAQASPLIMKELAPEKLQARYDANQRGLTKLAEVLEKIDPDVLIMVGDDQQELWTDDNMPAMSVYRGDDILLEARAAQAVTADQRLEGYTETNKSYPTASGLSQHILEYLIEAEFDVANSRYLKDGQGISEAFGFVYNRLMTGRVIPTVPFWLNAYYPPNQPTPKRCYDLGRALRGAVEAWKGPERVAILASGGLSHFVVDEELDQEVLKGMKEHDIVRLSGLPRARLNSGNSEIRNWIAVAGASEHLEMDLVDYVPCYRSPAGTGCAMGFATWT